MQHQEQVDRNRLTQEEVEFLNLATDPKYPGLYKFKGTALGLWAEIVRVDRPQHLSSVNLKELRAMPPQYLEAILSSDSGHLYPESDENGERTGRLVYLTKGAMEELVHSN